MPKLTKKLPKECRDREQSFSWHNGKRYYHGRWGSPEAAESYRRFRIALLEGSPLLFQNGKTGDALISELAAGFIQHAESRNMDKADVGHFKTTIGYLVEVYGGLSVNEFSPRKLKTVRNLMVKAGTLSRRMINKYVGKIRTIFKWGIEEEVVNPNVEHALRAVNALRKGEQGTFDKPPRKNVPDDVVERTLPFLSPTVSAMVQLQRMVGMRPSEIFRMRVGDIDRGRDNGLWYYMPGSYKTEQYVGAIEFPLGEDEQKLIAPYLEGKKPSESVFSPRQAFYRSFYVAKPSALSFYNFRIHVSFYTVKSRAKQAEYPNF